MEFVQSQFFAQDHVKLFSWELTAYATMTFLAIVPCFIITLTPDKPVMKAILKVFPQNSSEN